MTFSIVTVWGI